MSVPPRSKGKSEEKAEGSYFERKIKLPAQEFIHTETLGAGVLLVAALVALAWANSPWSDGYRQLWEETYLGFDLGFVQIRENLRHWINDALMVIFFFVIGLEVKSEFVEGELSTWKKASLPLMAAFGGMIVPAGIYAAMNLGGPGISGWGVPMATDIAFALGVVALAGDALPFQARVFLLALAAADDIGAILVIAAFYSSDVSITALLVALALLAAMFGLRKIGLRDVKFYLLAGFAVWLAVFESGIHATIAGVSLGLLTPSKPLFAIERFRDGLENLTPRFSKALAEGKRWKAESLIGHLEALAVESEAPLDRRMRKTHPWASFLILPLFALANAGVEVSEDALFEAFTNMIPLGIVLGLVVGKTVGIFLFSYLAVRLGIGELPKNVTWRMIFGLGLTAGVGFTVSLFIADLAFSYEAQAAQAKIGILIASAVAGIGGILTLRYAGAPSDQETE